ncbi:carotenoid oxygenase family protein [Chondromyces crocatus]|uniref:Carotenoid oxygenase n=1 Tax=Chondromyces crocatus TaxID=52 RepID=A0A0K1EMZ7_CHOCO|nr:carotenoid oxygenase family protein [Chondromyces crocatus]AKT42003.1 carotenoid oxygenase [Chondromyces crocatus]
MLLDRLLTVAPTGLRAVLGRPSKEGEPAQPASSSNAYLRGNFAPLREETHTEALEVVAGEVPRGLAGALFRIGPAPRFEPIDALRYHWFDGDGMVDAFHFDGGRVSHRRRWVRTDKFRHEEEAGRALFGGMRDLATSTPPGGWIALGFSPMELLELHARSTFGVPLRDDQIHRVMRSQDRSNTNVLQMAGRLLSLEESSAAYELDPRTLETRGRFTFGGVLDVAPMVAHPKVDPKTGVIYTFGYGSVPPYVVYYVFGPDGALRLRRPIDTTYPSMMHDFSVTETRAVFYHLPATLWMDNMKSGEPVRWEPSRGARIGVTARDDADAPVRWIDIPPCYVFHPMNAYDDGETLVLDIARYPRLPLFDLGGEAPNPRIQDNPEARLTRLRVDVQRGTVTEEALDEDAMEFPVVDPRHAMRPYRYGWAVSRRGACADERGMFNAITRYDLQERRVQRRLFGRASFPSEPIVVPRSATSAEGEGWLLTVVYHADEDRSELVVLDALDVEGAPVAVLRCPHRIPYGFHGSFVEATAL